MTAVRSDLARDVIELLLIEGLIPAAISDRLEIVEWSGPFKDLRFIKDADLNETWIVDDQERYIHPDQKSNWVPIVEYDPWIQDDAELLKVKSELCKKLT